MPPKHEDEQDWPEHRMWVKKTLESIQAELKETKEAIVGLRIQSGLWGFLAGMIPPVLIQLCIYLLGKRGP